MLGVRAETDARSQVSFQRLNVNGLPLSVPKLMPADD